MDNHANLIVNPADVRYQTQCGNDVQPKEEAVFEISLHETVYEDLSRKQKE
jgi:hypothetical protein